MKPLNIIMGFFFFFLQMQKNAKPSNAEELRRTQMCILERFPTVGRECVTGGASVAGVELGGSQEWPVLARPSHFHPPINPRQGDYLRKGLLTSTQHLKSYLCYLF